MALNESGYRSDSQVDISLAVLLLEEVGVDPTLQAEVLTKLRANEVLGPYLNGVIREALDGARLPAPLEVLPLPANLQAAFRGAIRQMLNEIKPQPSARQILVEFTQEEDLIRDLLAELGRKMPSIVSPGFKDLDWGDKPLATEETTASFRREIRESFARHEANKQRERDEEKAFLAELEAEKRARAKTREERQRNLEAPCWDNRAEGLSFSPEWLAERLQAVDSLLAGLKKNPPQ